jgi:hypothetical protein
MSQEGTYGDTGNRQENTSVAVEAGATADEAAVETPAEQARDEPVEEEASAEPALPLDVAFEILKNSRRRTVLEYLRDADDTVTIGELAEHIAAIENDTTVQQLNAQQRKRVYIGLYQCHLPKMDDSNVVDFNQDRGLVTVTPAAEQLYAYLDTNEDSATPNRPYRYLLFTGLTAAGFLLAQAAGAYTVASIVVVGYLAALAVHTIREGRLESGD